MEESARPSSVLKAETSAQHAFAEAEIDWPQVFGSLANYRNLLRGLLWATAPAEGAIEQILGESVSDRHAPEEFTGWLRHDLRQLSHDAGIQEEADQEDGQGPCQHEYQFLKSRADAIGALYVLEGSLLGGQYLRRELQKQLGIGPENGGRYYEGRGVATKARWREFQKWLDEELSSPVKLQNAVSAARDTFGVFGRTIKAATHDCITGTG